MRRCPRCGFETVPDADLCPLCGIGLTAGAAGGAEADGGRPVPWEDPGRSFPSNLFATWRESLFSPTSFFRRVRMETPFSRALLYFLLMAVGGAFFSLWWEAVGVASSDFGVYSFGESAGVDALVEFFLSPFLSLVGLAVWTAILHLMCVVLVRPRRGMGATARAICYAAGPTLLTIVPVLGGPVAGVWSIVLQVVGLRELHGTTTGRAAAAVLVPVFLLLLVLVGLVFLLAGVLLLEGLPR